MLPSFAFAHRCLRPCRLHAALAIAACALLAACAGHGPCDASPYASSPQFKGCGFRNPPNPQALPSASPWKIWPRFLFETKTGTMPIDPIPVHALGAAQLDALDPQANHVARIGHSSSLLKLRGSYWLIDPMFSERASPFQWIGPKRFEESPIALAQLPAIEGVIISHDHYDHLDAATIGYLAQRAQRFFVPLGVGRRLIALGVPADRITELDWWQSATQGEVQVTAVPAQHFSGRSLDDRDDTLWAGWVMQSGTQRIYYSGDSGYSPNFRQIGERFGGFDLALIENGAYDSHWPSVHMTPEQSVQAFEEVHAQVLLPVHNSTFDLAFHPWQEPMARIAKLAEDKHIELATPELGEVVTIGVPRANVRWWEGVR
ncbi:metal-dependent hydrolase [Variovorax sp. SRS16]|nr:MBL fold metallo-hydrolase [Variovorax sp. SRS16]VTU22925.1 metal-dependent hydrolase [Variovorax sp. SRS16]